MNNVETLFNVPEIVTGTARRTRVSSASPATSSGPAVRAAVRARRCGSCSTSPESRPPKAVLLGGAAGSFLRPDQLDLPLSFEAARAAGVSLGSGVVIVYDESADLVDAVLRIAEFFRDESCGQCVPCRVGTVRQEEALHRLASGAGERRRACGARRPRAGDARRVDLRTRPDRRERRHVGDREPRGARMSVALTIDGLTVSVDEGSTILDACRKLEIATPTLCYADTLTPVNVCRVCVVEVEGSRTLVPSCSRKVEPGMVVHTDSPRVRTSRRLVLELLGSSVDLSRAPDALRYIDEYDAHPERFGEDAATVAQPVKIDNDLYVRDYSRCILCYKCVEACGEDHQNTFAIAVAGRGFDAHISTELDVALPESACVYCGNCVAVCPTGALIGKASSICARPAPGTSRSRSRSTPSARTAASAAT